MEWTTRGRGNFTYETMCDAIRSYINADLNYKYKLNVGTDSQNHFLKTGAITKFVNAIIIRRVGKGGQYYVHKWDEKYISSTRQKIYYEATSTLVLIDKLAEDFADLIEAGILELQPDADIGEKGKTKEFISEIVGMFKASGYDNVQIKPDSYCSSSVADRHSK